MYYHFAMLLLFRPLITYRIVGSEVMPQDVCSQAADAIQALLASYAQLYTLKRTPSFVPYFVLTSTTMKLAVGAAAMRRSTLSKAVEIHKELTEALHRAVDYLGEMVACHQFAAQALSIVRYLAKAGSIADANEDEEVGNEYDRSGGDFYLSYPAVVSGHSSPLLHRNQPQAGGSVQTPLFWLSLAQAQVMFPGSKALDETGFQEL